MARKIHIRDQEEENPGWNDSDVLKMNPENRSLLQNMADLHSSLRSSKYVLQCNNHILNNRKRWQKWVMTNMAHIELTEACRCLCLHGTYMMNT